MKMACIPARGQRAGFAAASGFGLALLVLIGWMAGCAPLPPLEEKGAPVVEEKRSELSKAERDSIIAIYRSFAYERWKNGDWETARKHFNTVRFHDLEHKHNIYRTWADCFVREGLMDSALYA